MRLYQAALESAVALTLAHQGAALNTPFRTEFLNGAGLLNVAIDSYRSTQYEAPPPSSGPLYKAKKRLKDTLVANGGQTRTREVYDIIRRLQALEPPKDAAFSPHMEGRWKVISAPNIQSSLEQDERGRCRCTLGEMSSNMYGPCDLACTVENVWEPIGTPSFDSDNRGYEYTYAVDVKLSTKCRNGHLVEAHMVDDGFCSPAAEDANRLDVIFTKGYIRPSPTVDMDSWRDTLLGAETATGRDRMSLWLGKVFVGLVPPSGMEDDGTIFYEVQRPRADYVDILFLDDTLRITRGKRGCVAVAERVD